jgi:hypothetical protein
VVGCQKAGLDEGQSGGGEEVELDGSGLKGHEDEGEHGHDVCEDRH